MELRTAMNRLLIVAILIISTVPLYPQAQSAAVLLQGLAVLQSANRPIR
jgi:hypothetical protein